MASNLQAIFEDSSENVLDLLGNDSDPDGDAFSITSVDTTGTDGNVINDGTSVRFTPTPKFMVLHPLLLQ